MCCGSHGGAGRLLMLHEEQNAGESIAVATPIRQGDGTVTLDFKHLLGAELAESSEELCRCNGGPVGSFWRCACRNKHTQEDLRCDICRVWCQFDWTARVMSDAFAKTGR